MPIKPANTDLSYAAAAKTLSVSKASILNWIKNGELKTSRRGHVSLQSLKRFENEIAGQTRLQSRANKLHQKDKETPPLAKLSQDGDTQSSVYESRLGNVWQNKEGVYYTPASLIDAMLSKIPGDVSNLTFLDPCCGTGNFLLGAIRRGFKPDNIYGQDCDANALKIAKMRLETRTGNKYENLTCFDFLNPPIHGDTKSYDVIATNPPWGKKYTVDEKTEFAKRFGLKAPIGSSALFSLEAMKRVKKDGYAALLLPESCSNIAVFEPLRKHFLNHNILALEDHGRAFEGLMTHAHSIILKNTDHAPTDYIACYVNEDIYHRPRAQFVKQPKSIFNFTTHPDEAAILDHLFNQPHITLKDKARWGLGIVTGSNKTLCRTIPFDGDKPVYKGSDISKSGLKPPTLYLNPDLSQYRQTAPRALYNAQDKLIYKFISQRLVFYHDTKQRLILNSANMIVPDKNFPLTPSQLCFLFNTDLMNFIFEKTFATRKVLRSDLETLPIFHTFFTPHSKPTEKNLLAHLGLIKTNKGYALSGLKV